MNGNWDESIIDEMSCDSDIFGYYNCNIRLAELQTTFFV